MPSPAAGGRGRSPAGTPFSLTAPAYDIYAAPRNLREKLRAAALVTSGCDYTVHDLERIGGRPVAKVVMGVDLERFRRRTAAGHGDGVLAAGRLVAKKGFVHLVRAAAELPRIRVRIVGAREPAAVRDLLEEAAVLAMPCVVAPDGDRDSMPVVVKEALAMEVPVVASDEVGLPELIRPVFGR